jgi:hypothetical protein
VTSCLSLPRVLALTGGLGLVATFFMPWFGTQGILLSGQFLHTFLSNATPNQLAQFLPGTGPTEVLLLRGLVDGVPVSGALAALTVLVGGLVSRGRAALNSIAALSGLVALVGWVVGMSRLPPGGAPEVGLWLIGLCALAVLVGLAGELLLLRRHARMHHLTP